MTVAEFMFWWCLMGAVCALIMGYIVYRETKREFQLGKQTGDELSRKRRKTLLKRFKKHRRLPDPAKGDQR